MNIPFTKEQFLEVFELYNTSVWPTQILLVLLALAAIFLTIKKPAWSDKAISVILAFFWLWIGIVYHLLFFTAINKAAYAFGAFFIIQGFLFLFQGAIRSNLSFRYRSDSAGVVGTILLLFALVIYPAVGYFAGHVYPQSPTFGLPCPTTIFTFGLLLWTDKRFPSVVLAIPFLWSLLGFTAAFNFGIIEDTGLLIAGVMTPILLGIRNRKQQATPAGHPA